MTVVGLFILWIAADVTVLTPQVSAAELTTRSVKISSSEPGGVNTGAAGSGSNGAEAQYTFGFTVATAGQIQSMLFEACTTPLPGTTCTAPTGMNMANLAGATLTTTGTNFTSGFSVDNTTVLTGTPYNCSGTSPGRTNCLAVTRSSASSVSGAVTLTYTVNSSHYITNPTSANSTFFIRITTYSDAAYSTAVDSGTVANSTAQSVNITALVQETLNFSVGTTVTAPSTNCTAFSDSGNLALGNVNGVLSYTQAYDGHSYFRVSTNAGNGTAVFYSGGTLTSGANTITAIGTSAASSTVGSPQFGLAIDPSDTESGSGYSFSQLSSTAPYGNGNGTITNGGSAQFAFSTASATTPVQIASSSGTITCDTGSVRYIGNISTTTPPGIYTTTITYIAAPTY